MTSLLEVFLVYGGAFATAAPSQQEPHVPSIDELIELESPGEVAIAPSGGAVAFTRSSCNWDEDRYETQIWLASGGQAEPYPLTRHSNTSHSPRWAPDGSALFFLSERGEETQLYRLPMRGGEAELLTEIESGVRSYALSPKGDWIAVAVRDEASEEEEEREEQFGEFEWVGQEARHTHLWRLDLATKEVERLTEGSEYTIGSYRISPEGTAVAFDARPSPRASDWVNTDLYLLDLSAKESSDGRVVKLVDSAGPDMSPVWSPDGRSLAFVHAGGDPRYFVNRRLAIVSRDGSGLRVVTGEFDENPSLLEWSTKGIFFAAWQRTERHLFLVDPGTNEHRRVSALPGWVLGSISITPTASSWAFTADRFDRFTEVYRSSVKNFQPEALTNFEEQTRSLRLGVREVISWQSEDGEEIEGILIKPQDFDPSRRYPILFRIHGGPAGVDAQRKLGYSARRYYPVDRFIARDAIVVMPNYRGSAGYGQAFRSLNYRNLGLGDEADVHSCLDALIARGLADPERVGTMGWSQGGYISAFLSTHSTRFKAASVGAGISDWMTYYVNTDIQPFTRFYLGATPWEDREIYDRTSPIHYLQSAQTPTLIQHGENDARVPLPNAFELYQGLKDREVPVRLAVFDGFGHGINRPKSNRAVMKQNEEWFVKWIWGGHDELADESTEALLPKAESE